MSIDFQWLFIDVQLVLHVDCNTATQRSSGPHDGGFIRTQLRARRADTALRRPGFNLVFPTLGQRAAAIGRLALGVDRRRWGRREGVGRLAHGVVNRILTLGEESSIFGDVRSLVKVFGMSVAVLELTYFE